MRVFLDTNVVVSGFTTRGLCADVLTQVLAEHELVLGERVLTELRRVLRQKLRVSPKRIDELEAFLRAQARVVEVESRPLIKVRDVADAWILTEAMAGSAAILVTGDRGLLEVAPKAPFPIVTPRGFWERLRGDRRAK